MASTNDFIVQLIAQLDSSKTADDLKKIEQQLNAKGINLKTSLDTATSKQQLQKLAKQLQSVLKSSGLEIDTSKIMSAFNQVSKEADKLVQNVNKIQHSLGNGDYDVQLKAYTTSLQKAGIEGKELETKISGATIALKKLRTSATDDNIIPDEVINKATTLDNEFKKLANNVKNINLDNSLFASNINVDQTIIRLNEQLRKNSAYSSDAKKKIKAWIDELDRGNIAEARLKEINVQAKQLHTHMGKLGNIGLSFFDKFKQGIESFTSWLSATSVIMAAINAFRIATNNVITLSNSLLELSKVSDLSVKGLEKVTNEAYELGETVGKTGKQVVDAVTEFKRAGYELENSMDMAEAALVMTNVAEGINETSDAAGTLISVLKGFKMSDTDIMSIVDKMNQVSNTSPIGFDELADGLERVSGTMNQAGNTIDQTLGLLTGGYAQLRNIEKVSSGMIFIQQRLRGIDEDGSEIEGLSAKLKDSFGEIGVAVENADGTLRSMYEIATDYAKVLPTLTSKQKQYYGELAAGNRQITVWNAITEQIADVENATNQAINSIGSASEENQKRLDSISGKISQFDSAVEQLSSTIVDSELLKFFVDFGIGAVKSINDVSSAVLGLTENTKGLSLVVGGIGTTLLQGKGLD